MYYGATHPLGHDPKGTEAAVGKLTPAALKASWATRSAADRATFVVAGAVDQETLSAAIDRHFSAWKPGATALPAVPQPRSPVDGPHLYMVDNPSASQSVLWVLSPGWNVSDPDLAAGTLGTIVLGGTFTSRLNRLLREEKGYTYGARSRAQPGADHGTVVSYSAVRGDATAPALSDLLGELTRIHEGVSAEETTKAAGAWQTRLVGELGTRAGIAGAYTELATQGASPDALKVRLEMAGHADAAAVGKALERLDLTRSVIVVVGDLSAVKANVEAAVPGEWKVVLK